MPPQGRAATRSARVRAAHRATSTRLKRWAQCGAAACRNGTAAGPCRTEADLSDAVLVCDQDVVFREALRNFLLAAGYARVEVAATPCEAFPKLRWDHYRYVLIGVTRPFSRAWRLAAIARQRQREAKIFFLVEAMEQPFVGDASRDYVIKEYVFTNLLELM
ncbi:MAG: hypothetical protein MUF20_12605 [Methylotetracoccus sp.]|nr:hypothetical protein [Methylotetracoccus sp.]